MTIVRAAYAERITREYVINNPTLENIKQYEHDWYKDWELEYLEKLEILFRYITYTGDYKDTIKLTHLGRMSNISISGSLRAIFVHGFSLYARSGMLHGVKLKEV